jgi:hypothetical protein
MEQKVAALRKMHAENLHHYDAHCPRCGRANAISRERLEMFTPGWEEAIKEPAMAAQAQGMAGTSTQEQPNNMVTSPAGPMMEPSGQPMPAMKKRAAAPSRRRHAPAAKKAAKKAPAKKATPKKAAAKKGAKPKKKTATKAKSKSSSRKAAKKRR